MPTLPWVSVGRGESSSTAVVMASRFRLRRFRDVPRFLLDSMRIHRQVQATDRALGVSLIARPLRREFFTLSARRDRAALDALVRADPHLSAMRRHRRAMAESVFTFWNVPSANLPVSWDEARRRLEAQARPDGPVKPDTGVPRDGGVPVHRLDA